MLSLELANRAQKKLQRSLLQASKSTYQRLVPKAPFTPTEVLFVAGNQRSGTNMLMNVLARSYATDVLHEYDRRAFKNYQMRHPDTIKKLVTLSRSPTVVVKALCELQRLDDLMTEFAPAKCVWIFRDFDDVINSMLISFRNHALQINRIAKDKHSDGWRSEGMSDNTHNIIRNFAHASITDASAAALIWYLRNVLFFEQGFEHNKNVQLIQYEELVRYPTREFADLFDFLGLTYKPKFSREVYVSSIGRGKPPAIEPGIRAICNTLFVRFETLLARQPRFSAPASKLVGTEFAYR